MGGVSSGGLVKRDKCDSRSGFRGFFMEDLKKTCFFFRNILDKCDSSSGFLHKLWR